MTILTRCQPKARLVQWGSWYKSGKWTSSFCEWSLVILKRQDSQNILITQQQWDQESQKNALQVNAFRQNCSQDGNHQDYDLILGVPAKRASIMDVHAATDAKYLSNVEDGLDVFLMFLKIAQGASDVFSPKVFEGCHQSRGRHISSWSPLNWEWGRFLNRFCSKSERHRNHSLLQVNTFRQNCSQEGNIRYFHFVFSFLGWWWGGGPPSPFLKAKNI